MVAVGHRHSALRHNNFRLLRHENWVRAATDHLQDEDRPMSERVRGERVLEPRGDPGRNMQQIAGVLPHGTFCQTDNGFREGPHQHGQDCLLRNRHHWSCRPDSCPDRFLDEEQKSIIIWRQGEEQLKTGRQCFIFTFYFLQDLIK